MMAVVEHAGFCSSRSIVTWNRDEGQNVFPQYLGATWVWSPGEVALDSGIQYFDVDRLPKGVAQNISTTALPL